METKKHHLSLYWLGTLIVILGIWDLALNVPLVHAAPMALASEPQDLNIFAKLAKQAVPSVVNLSVVNTVQTDFNGQPGGPLGSQPGGNFFQYFFGGNGIPSQLSPQLRGQPGFPKRAQKEVSLGTGFIIDSSGIILTNNHVVAHSDQVEINFTESADEKSTQGKVIGRDPDLDVALIQFHPTRKLVPVVLGDSDALEVGEFEAQVSTSRIRRPK